MSLADLEADSDNNTYFTLILWNPALAFKDAILKELPNVYETKEVTVAKDCLRDFVFEAYRMDTRCTHDVVLPPKIKRLKDYGVQHIFVRFGIDNPTYKNGVCSEAVRLKERIRAKYRDRIPNYTKDIIVHVADNQLQSKHIWELHTSTHRQVYDSFLAAIDRNNIRYVIIRGFRYLPTKPDTDLDIIVHPDDYAALLSVFELFKQRRTMRSNVPVQCPLSNAESEGIYHSLFTERYLSAGSHLPGKYYRFDLYNGVFFRRPRRGALLLPMLFRKYLFEHRVKVQNFYTPDPTSEVLLLVCRCLYEKEKWSKKHVDRIQELLSGISPQEFEKVASYIFADPGDLYSALVAKQFFRVGDSLAAFNLFIIRRKGLEPHIVADVLGLLCDNGYTIHSKFLVTIKDSQKLFRRFYENFDLHKEDILELNDHQCLTIVTDIPGACSPKKFKRMVRAKYTEFYPPIGNIIHASDSAADCERELAMLLNTSTSSFANIGTYYTSRRQ